MDKDNKPLKMISWQDNRASSEVGEIVSLLPQGDFYRCSGLPPAATWILPKLIWARKNDPELMNKTTRFVQLHDYILREFGAEDYFTPESDACMYGLWDVDHCVWNQNYASLFEINSSKLGSVLEVSKSIGKITDRIANLTGLPRGLNLSMGLGDQSAAVLGAGIINNHDISVSMGTGGMMIACVDTPMRDPNGAFLITNHAIHGKWQWEGLQNGSAGIYRWFRDEVAGYEKHIAQNAGSDVYDLLEQLAKTVPAGSRGLVVLPYFASAGTPRWNSDARGCVLGLTFAHDKACLTRAFMEGITMEHRDMLETIRLSGIKPNKIRIIGGPTKSETWNRIQASVYGIPVETLKFPDASVLGAAIAGAVGAGLYPSIQNAVCELVRPDKIYDPDANDVNAYQEIYALYTSAYAGLAQGTFKGLAKFQAKQ
jgi:xylulokinase